jgi:hypothetical protein
MEIDIDKYVEELEKKEASDNYYYAQMPKTLIEDGNISSSAKVLFCAYHLWCSRKNPEDLINGKCSTYVGQKRLSLMLKCSPLSIKRWQKELERFDYITIERRQGPFKTNLITLHIPKKNQIEQNQSIVDVGIK